MPEARSKLQYSDQGKLIAMTQERALRLLTNEGAFFDAVLIDEAHNLFEKSQRSILLSRFLRRNRVKNNDAVYYYFSPLVGSSDSLKLEELQEISESRISFNIKEPVINELRLNKQIYRYDRFLDAFHPNGSSSSHLHYILDNAKDKNFIYILKPKLIEEFSSELASELDKVYDAELELLANTLKENVHKDFYCVDYVQRGGVYIHGKLPDLVKEYLEYKFKQLRGLRYLIANTVILEGVNLPIDSLFIMSLHSLSNAQLWNLIGRVNRLNDVFGKVTDFEKLKPHVHFVNTERFNRHNSKMEMKIKNLRSTVFKDEIHNPTLPNFDRNKYIKDMAKRNQGDASISDKLQELDATIHREEYLSGLNGSDRDLKALMYETGLDSIYQSFPAILPKLEARIDDNILDDQWDQLRVVDKIYKFFIEGLEDSIKDFVFLRLRNIAARNFYDMFIRNLHESSLTEHINSTVSYFYALINDGRDTLFYVGSSYGEVSKSEDDYKTHYVELKGRSRKWLTNLALVKIKIESDYVSFDLNRYVSVLHDLELLDDAEYNLFVYGTEERKNTEFVKLGLSGSLINKLDKDGQLDNMTVSTYGGIQVNDKFRNYIYGQNDLVRFEVEKYIDIK